MSRKKIAARTGRTYAACRQRASTLGVRCIGTWTAEEDAVVRDTSYTLDAAAVELGRPATTVASRAQVLGVRRKKD